MKKISNILLAVVSVLVLTPNIARADMIIPIIAFMPFFAFENLTATFLFSLMLLIIVSITETFVFKKWLDVEYSFICNYRRDFFYILGINVISTVIGMLFILYFAYAFDNINGGFLSREQLNYNLTAQIAVSPPTFTESVGGGVLDLAEDLLEKMIYLIAIVVMIPIVLMFAIPVFHAPKIFNINNIYLRTVLAFIVSAILSFIFFIISFPFVWAIFFLGLFWILTSIVESPFIDRLARSYVSSLTFKKGFKISLLLNSVSYTVVTLITIALTFMLLVINGI